MTQTDHSVLCRQNLVQQVDDSVFLIVQVPHGICYSLAYGSFQVLTEFIQIAIRRLKFQPIVDVYAEAVGFGDCRSAADQGDLNCNAL